MTSSATRRTVAGLAVAIVPIFLWYIGTHRPGTSSFFPPCLFHLATGLYCPGCGGTRALHLLLNGDLGAAAGQNIFLLAVLPLAAVYFAALAIYAVSGKWAPPGIQGKTVTVCIAIAVIAFGVVRNLPGMELLAPKVLP